MLKTNYCCTAAKFQVCNLLTLNERKEASSIIVNGSGSDISLASKSEQFLTCKTIDMHAIIPVDGFFNTSLSSFVIVLILIPESSASFLRQSLTSPGTFSAFDSANIYPPITRFNVYILTHFHFK